MAESRRGRKSQSSYVVMVGKALKNLDDRFALDEFPVLSQLPAVEHWASSHEQEVLPRGKALQLLLRQAVNEIIERFGTGDDAAIQRFVEFLQLRYLQGVEVKTIAEQWDCSRVHVWRTCGQRSLEMVTQRFLELARSGATEGAKMTLLPNASKRAELTGNSR